ncbi:hypothetical protein, partial [Kaistella pullorum]|uniref:hypothetical protein n=1 Tax=Kaistella pullorum TaxID=2763074 RepID=UPI002044E730
ARISNAELITKTDFGPAEGSMGGNGLGIGVVLAFKVQKFSLNSNVDSSTNVEFCTSASIMPIPCCLLAY